MICKTSHKRILCAAAVSAVLASLSPALATDYLGVMPAALDQPRINAYISLTAGGPPQEFEETFNVQAFFDTGASGIPSRMNWGRS